MSVGVPIKLLHEALGHVVTIEMSAGEIYKGVLSDVEDNMNCQLQKVTHTARDGRVTHMEHVFIRGSRIVFVGVPEILRNAPLFVQGPDVPTKGRGAGFAATSSSSSSSRPGAAAR